MRGAWRLGRFAGIDTYVHWTFALLMAWAGWTAWQGAGSGLAVLLGLGFLGAVFASVLMHEFGHALVARRWGVPTRHILLTPLGGIASLEGMPSAPKAELQVALAGPAVNFVLAAALAIVGSTGIEVFGLVDALMWANLSLGLFNLIPAFPMDGGRALRALLAGRVGARAATTLAVRLGRVVAVAMGVLGVLYNPMLLLIAVFVWFAGAAEARASAATEQYDLPWRGASRAAFDDAVLTWRASPQAVIVGRRIYYR
jgi:Zn-dependent protease